MYFHNVVGTGSYTTSTTNMYNKYQFHVPAKSDARTKTVKFTFCFHGRKPNGAFVKKRLVLIILVLVVTHHIKIKQYMFV